MSDNTSDPDRIERDLDQTRSRLGSHLSELQSRLSPGQVVDDLMGYFRGSEGADFGRSLLDSVRANPIPAALTGIGLAWLMASNPRAGQAPASLGGGLGATPGSDWNNFDATTARLRGAEQGVSRHPDEAEHDYTYRLDQARGHAVGLSRNADETTQSFGQRIRDALANTQRSATQGAHDLRDQVSGSASAAGDAVGSLGAAAQGMAQSVGSTVQDAARQAGDVLAHRGRTAGKAGSNLVAALTENPALLGVLGLAAGAVLGALLPQSDQEEAALGGIAGQARDTVSGLAKEAMQRGSSVAQTVIDKGSESAKAHGLGGDQSAGSMVDAALSGKLASSAKNVLQDAMQTGEEAIRKQAPQPGQETAKPS